MATPPGWSPTGLGMDIVRQVGTLTVGTSAGGSALVRRELAANDMAQSV